MVGFKDIPDWENYQIDKKGRIYSKYSNKFLKPKLNPDGYLKYELYRGNQKSKTFFAHRLVAMVYLKNPMNKQTVNHKNGIKTDNRLSNLEWNTRSENIKHGYNTGLCKKVKTNRFRILNKEDILDIRNLYKTTNITQKELAKKFKVSKSLIGAIIRNEVWKHL